MISPFVRLLDFAEMAGGVNCESQYGLPQI